MISAGLKRSRSIRAIVWGLLAPLAVLPLSAQSPSGAAAPVQASASAYVVRSSLPSTAREFLIALGDRIQKPGKERLVLVGTFTDKSGATPATLVWQAPGSLRFDRSVRGSPPLIYTPVSGVANRANLSDSELAIVESLLNDGPEDFLYSFSRGHGLRFLGGRFRTDDGKSPNYAGPLFDIYEKIGPVEVTTGTSLRQKFYHFDSQTKLLAKVTYLISQGGVKVSVSTEYANWSNSAGQAIPAKILRRENGVIVFTFDVASIQIGPGISDGLFGVN